MTSSDLDRLRRKHQQFIDEQLENQIDDSDDDPSSLLSEITLAGARRIDPLASRRATLAARLSGERIRPGAVDVQTLADVVTPLRIEVASASPGDVAPRLELVGLGSGSAVLHFEPVAGEIEGEGSAERVQRVDGAVNRVLDAHALIERNGSVSDLSGRYGDLLDGLGRLTAAMAAHEVELELEWNNADGVRRRPVLLGRRGVAYAGRVFERTEVSDEVDVDGFVYSISLSGELTLKQNLAKPNSRTYHIRFDPAQFSELGLGLGDHVVIAVARRTVKDLTGRERSAASHTLRAVRDVRSGTASTSASPTRPSRHDPR